LTEIIKKKNEQKVKKRTLDTMVNSLLTNLLFKNCERIGLKFIKGECFRQIERYDVCKEAIREETNEELDSISFIQNASKD
jgi:hypothetical protein